MTTTNDHNERSARALARHTGLLDGLLGTEANDVHISLIVLGEIYELSDADGAAIDALIERLKAARAAYTFTVAELASTFQVHPDTVRRYVRRGLLKGDYVDGRLMFTEKQVQRFLQESAERYARPGERVSWIAERTPDGVSHG
jgi:hypothetical protein